MIGVTGQSQQLQQKQQSHHEQQQRQRSTATAHNNPSSNHHNQPHHQHLVNHRQSNANQKHNADDDYLEDHGMRIGHNYQAEIPQFIAYAPAPEYYEDEKAIRVWSPHNKIPDHVLDEFISKAKDKFFYNMEQALGMLSWHKFDLNRAYADLANFVPYPNEWSVEDKVLFEQAYQFHEKQFNKIKQMLPDKPMSSLINYYYMWKKTRTRASLMERQSKRFAAKKNADSNENSDDGSAEEEDGEAEGQAEADGVGQNEGENDACSCCVDALEPNVDCCLCTTSVREHGKNNSVIVLMLNDRFCEKCYLATQKLKLTGGKMSSQPATGDCFFSASGMSNRQLLFTYADAINLTEGSAESGDMMLKLLDSQIHDRRRDIQSKKQTLSQINEKIQPIAEQIADLNMDEFKDILPEYKPTKEWSAAEAQLVVQGIRRYGKDFSAISDVVRTKSPEQITLFWSTQAEKLGLKVLVEEYERTAGSSAIQKTEESDTTSKAATDQPVGDATGQKTVSDKLSPT